MNTSYFCFDEQKTAIRRVKCMDGNVRVIVADIFHAARNMTRNHALKMYSYGSDSSNENIETHAFHMFNRVSKTLFE